MACGGCEAKTPVELYLGASGSTLRHSLAPNWGGVSPALHTPVYIELTEPGGGTMDAGAIWPPEAVVTESNGSCNADCSQATSCSVVLTFKLTFFAIMPDPSGAGPDPNFGPILTFTPPAGGTVEGGSTIDLEPETTVTGVTVRDDEAGIVGSVSYLVKYTVAVTFEPGCGNTASYVIGFANFAIDPGAGWTRTNPVQNSPTFEIGCHECQGSKRGSITQATAGNANTASLDFHA